MDEIEVDRHGREILFNGEVVARVRDDLPASIEHAFFDALQEALQAQAETEDWVSPI